MPSQSPLPSTSSLLGAPEPPMGPPDAAPRGSGHSVRDRDISESPQPVMRTATELRRASSREELGSLGVLHVLAADDRPTFIIDTAYIPLEEVPFELVYSNPAFQAEPLLLSQINGTEHFKSDLADNVEPYSRYRRWLFRPRDVAHEPPSMNGTGKSHIFGGYIWSEVTVGHWRILSGIPKSIVSADQPKESSNETRIGLANQDYGHGTPTSMPQFASHRLPQVPPVTLHRAHSGSGITPPASTKQGPFDCTLETGPVNMSAHIEYFRTVDWSQTPLGPMDSWCNSLRAAVNIIMHDTHPAVLFWGGDVIMIYNEPYIEIIGRIHPCLGKSARVAASAYWVHFQPLVDHINATGQTLSELDLPIFLDRHGFLEETFFSFQLIPILNSDGYIGGYYQPLIETTKNKLLERRVSSLVEIGSQTAKARDFNTYWELVLNTLAINDKDAPFALLYATEHEYTSDLVSASPPGSAAYLQRCLLKGTIGVAPDHPIAPTTVDFKTSTNTYVFIPYLIEAEKSRKPFLVHFNEIRMPPQMLSGIEWKGYGDSCRCVVVCPILPATGKEVQGFLILGINPRRPFDDDYQQFIHVMNRLLATSLASVVLFDDEIRQKEKAIGRAADVQQRLMAELRSKEKKFQRLAERSEIAIFVTDMNGKYTYRNQRWYAMFDVIADEEDVAHAWTTIAFPEDLPWCEALFEKLVVEKEPISFELRTNMPWKRPDGVTDPDCTEKEHFVWILCYLYPELGPDNELREIVGNVTDISQQKHAEVMQRSRTDSALESKKHLEHFIDTTSHEMRNPLSAIMQCADAILTSYSTQNAVLQAPSPKGYASLIDETLDSAQTIAQCAQHMTRIVDDILTISKLDSGLLQVTPIDAQPEVVSGHAVKMFEGEAKAAGVRIKFEVEQSYRDLGINWVSLDPTRLLQILINLITNAIKFTRLENIRMITVSIGASEQKPDSAIGGIEYTTRKLVADDPSLKEDWERGPTVYLQFSVSDTGRGISPEEKAVLFARFSQASPRTHINYGGSGLGLFISRRLTEMQGGAIGLASQRNKGSTFSFYVKARRSMPSRRGSAPVLLPPDDLIPRRRMSSETDEDPTSIRPPTIHRQTENFVSPKQTLVPAAEPDFTEINHLRLVQETLHVLVVEDNLVNQKVLAKQLRNLGCIVHVANHGGECLDFLKKSIYWSDNERSLSHTPIFHIACTEPPPSWPEEIQLPLELSVILMDWEMPIMNGLTAVARIREWEREGLMRGHVPVIGVTANVRQQQISRAMEAGMDDVVGKPFRVQALLGQMRAVVAGEIPLLGEKGREKEGEE